ncbi:MAG: phosphoribosylanthranilate isomerase [Bryobacteraceae bacterium]|nr:phosphoribosylanthranilate isomerase [Bryobacteraceae bacterium]MDW8377893.1 phosphoribosylanthranilate isomerase [Bryobacterales bacterium]
MIKVCGITKVEDAEVAAEAGADALGLNFYPRSKRYVTPEQARRIAAAVPARVWKVGVFVNERARVVESIAREVGLDVVQLHGDEPPEALPQFPRIWKAFRVEPGFGLEALDRYGSVEAILLDGPAGSDYGGSGKPFAWSIAAAVLHRTILAGGLDASNVAEAIAAARPWGVDACSRLEIAPGVKHHGKMREFIETARAVKGWR